MSNRHQVRLCGGPAADRAAALSTILPGQETVLSSLQPISGLNREVRDRAR